MPTGQLTDAIIEAAIRGFEAQKKEIDVEIADLRAMLTNAPKPVAVDAPSSRKGRKLSPEVIERMKAGQQRRWAKVKGKASAAPVAATPDAVKPKRRLSETGRRAIVAATKKRWAAKKAA
jgi:hypothetical protein